MGAGDVKLMAAIGAWLGPGAGALDGDVRRHRRAASSPSSSRCRPDTCGRRSPILADGDALACHGLEPVPELTLEHDQGPRLAYAVPIFIGLLVTLWRSS